MQPTCKFTHTLTKLPLVFANNLTHSAPQPFSSLFVSGRFGSRIISLFKPLFDVDYLNSLVSNKEAVKQNFTKRRLTAPVDLDQVFSEIPRLVHLKSQLSSLEEQQKTLVKKFEAAKRKNKVGEELIIQTKSLNSQVKQVKEKVWDLEAFVIPLVLCLPNDVSEEAIQYPGQQVLEEFRPRRTDSNFKHLDFNRLSYLNQCYFKSIVGPKSWYLLGIGAKLQLALNCYFSNFLRSLDFTEVSGVDFVKTAVLEACRYIDFETLKLDSCKLDKGTDTTEDNQKLHFVGSSSFESLLSCAFKKSLNNLEDSIRIFSVGNEFSSTLEQLNSVHGICLIPKNKSEELVYPILKLCFEYYKNLEVPCRVVKCGLSELSPNQYSRCLIQVWISSKNQWLTVFHIALYNDYISRRLGIKNVEIVDVLVSHTTPIILAIIENNQTKKGTFEIPKCLKPTHP